MGFLENYKAGLAKRVEENKRIATEQKEAKQLLKAEKKATIEKFKPVTKGKKSLSILITQDSSTTFMKNILFPMDNIVYQHEAGKVVIDNLKEYYIMSYTWTPNIVGNKQFSAAKALTGAALIGELGLIAGAKGKKGVDKSYATLLLKDIETGEFVKMVGDVKVGQAEKLAGFITAEEIGLKV